MATRKDLLKAHTFIHQRLMAALVNRDPDNPERPLRRIGMGTFIGAMLGILITAGFGLVGLINPGNSQDWKQDKTIVINTEAGGVMVYLGGRLYPTHNITSARLATGGGPVKTVKSKTLRDVPRERTIGIRQAPAQLPSAKDLTAFPLRVCSAPAPATLGVASGRVTSLEIGQGESPAASESFVAKADGDGKEYLVAGGTAYAMPNHAVAIQLGFGQQVVRPGNAFLRSLPQGPALTPIDIPDAGSISRRPVEGVSQVIGTLVHVEGAAKTYFVLLDSGLAEITPLEAVVLEASTGRRSVAVQASAANAARSTAQRTAGRPGMPATMPKRSETADLEEKTVCAFWADADHPPQVAFGQTTVPVTTRNADPDQADTVVMGSLRGALVKAEGSLGTQDPGVLIVEGKRYGLADQTAKEALGYADVAPVQIPTQVLRLIPAGLPRGQTLSVDAALQQS